MFGWLKGIIEALGDLLSDIYEGIGEAVSKIIWDTMLRWVYETIYGAIADFFTSINQYGAEMFDLGWHVNALVRRTYGFSQQEQVVTFGNVTVNLTARSVTKNGVSVSLSLREFDLLAYLCRHPNTAIPKDTLLSEVWGAFSAVEPSTLAVHIRWLREKLEDNPAVPQYIKTVYRVGYLLEV